MSSQNNIDFFDDIDWSKVDQEKAGFIYNEAIAYLDLVHKSDEDITNKATNMLSFSMPVLTALIGYFILQWGSISIPYRAMSICSIVFLVAILVLLLFILLPKRFNSPQGEPSAYFTNNYYKKDMTDILHGNIQALHKNINDDRTTQKNRAILLRATIVLYTGLPIISALFWLAAFLITEP